MSKMEIKQVSSLEKIRELSDVKAEIEKAAVLKGEVYSFQQIISCKEAEIKVSLSSELKPYIKLYEVKKTAIDYPCNIDYSDDDYITKEAGLMPDLLVPLEEQNGYVKISTGFSAIWVEVNVPHNITPKTYEITLNYDARLLLEQNETVSGSKTFEIEVLDAELPKQEIIVTQWFHTDCIAVAHNVEIYSEKHWRLIEEYMKEAVNQGANMILVPVITPPLDIKPGMERPNVQLVKITRSGDKYDFDFSKLKRFIVLAKKCGMEYFEISHLFSQWGLEYSPNIYVFEDGEEKHLFGWHVSARDKSYKNFLEQLLPELLDFLKNEKIIDNCYFHLSDEPRIEHLEAYKYACELTKPYLKNMKVMDAISDVAFYNTGLISTPVTATNCIEPFLEKKIENQWAYYCETQGYKVANRFMAMPSSRNRILGLQLYKFDIKGFLHWGYNFYYSEHSLFPVNPYVTTSGENAFPSGDAFTVYPWKNGAVPSLRAKVFREAIQDISLLKLLEGFIGKSEVIKLIEEKAGMEITFSEYPRGAEFLLDLNKLIKDEIKKHI